MMLSHRVSCIQARQQLAHPHPLEPFSFRSMDHRPSRDPRAQFRAQFLAR
jgi:hypothetical protein